MYKVCRKVVICKSHIRFLKACLESGAIPKRFSVKNTLPGCRNEVQNQLNLASFTSMKMEKVEIENKLQNLMNEKDQLFIKCQITFSAEVLQVELVRLEKHLAKVDTKRKQVEAKKLKRDEVASIVVDGELFSSQNRRDLVDVTPAIDDATALPAHNGTINIPSDRVQSLADVTIVSDDDVVLPAHIGPSNIPSNLVRSFDDVTLVPDDDAALPAHKVKRKRHFKRKYLQPQQRRKRKRKRARNFEQVLNQAQIESWNGVLKNISGSPVTEVEESLFARGKQFSPVELDPPIIRMQKELNRFYRIVRIKWLFYEKPDARTELEKKFYQKSEWEPPNASVEVENFITDLQHKFDNWKPPRWIPDNLSKKERQFLKEVQKDEGFVYMWEDKGPSFTKMTRNQYLETGKAELDNNDFYEKVQEDPSHDVKRKCDILVQKMVSDDEISAKVGEYLLSGDEKLSHFYHLLKSHKIPTDLSDPLPWLHENGFPVRGIISCLNSPTERLAGFIDHFLQPGMKGLSSFLQDTKHTLQLISQLNDQIENGELSLEGVSLVSLDVKQMYNNITEDLGNYACRRYLESRPLIGCTSANSSEENIVSTSSLMQGLDLCIKNNYFTFDRQIYRQKGGVGTGVKLAPPYACLAMGEYEKQVFSSDNHIIQLIKFWKRFIDDIFMLFKGTKEDCQKLVDWLNSIMPGVIQLSCNYSTESLEFLDLKIMIKQGRLETEIFVKPTNLQLFLEYDSNHPTHCKNAIVYCQALRVIERCSEQGTAEPHLANLKEKFIARKYPIDLVEEQFRKAKEKDRKSLIFKSRKQKSVDDKVRLIFTHNRGNPPLQKWLNESKKFLVSAKGKEFGRKFQIAYKQPKNLRRLVAGCKEKVQNTPPEDGEVGCYKCNHCRVSCPVITESQRFRSTNTQRSYPIKHKMTCDSSYVIYLATCKRCKGQYVGKATTKFKIRHSNHKQEIKHGKGGLGQHYGLKSRCSYKDISFILIEKVEQGKDVELAKREQFWQHQLRAFAENGGNAHCIKKEIF